VVHETNDIIMSTILNEEDATHLGINLIDHLNRFIHFACMYGIPHLHSLPYTGVIPRCRQIRLLRELLRGLGVAFRDEILHDDTIYVTTPATSVSANSVPI